MSLAKLLALKGKELAPRVQILEKADGHLLQLNVISKGMNPFFPSSG